MGVPLAAVADDGHCFILEQVEIGILVIINFHGAYSL
jgi:hypothetical protein